jgi:hypothetical protein
MSTVYTTIKNYWQVPLIITFKNFGSNVVAIFKKIQDVAGIFLMRQRLRHQSETLFLLR